MSLQTCTDISEAIALESSLGLYLKPTHRIKISVQLPKLKVPGQSISSWQVMEKLKATVRPDQFMFLKTLKITSTVMKLEGEMETKASCERALARLKAVGGLKLPGFSEWLQIRAAHALSSGPTRHDWDAFFRDARGVDEMKPGERPDTVHLQELPVRWFAETGKQMKASERIIRKAFATFGRIRRLEIPGSVGAEGSTFGKTSSLHRDLCFETYIQYEEYVEFATAMDSLRGKKLLYKDSDGKVYAVDIKVDFDRTNYLSDRSIKKRAAECKSTVVTPISGNIELPHPVKVDTKEIIKLNTNVLEPTLKVEKDNDRKVPDKKLDPVQKEAKFLMKELLHRAECSERRKEKIKEEVEKSRLKQLQMQQQKEEEIRRNEEKKNKEKLIKQERILKRKLLKNLKAKEQQKMTEIREELRKKLSGRKILKSVLANSSSNSSYQRR